MREHQIVITLKPEQFLEVQRLARAANAKSMGIFVRQQLLAALGLEPGAEAPVEPKSTAGDVSEVLVQIKRLHGDLKTFVAESISLYEINPEAIPDMVAQSAPAAEATVALEAAAQPVVGNDELERIAERAFAISPRLGAIGEPADERSASASGAAVVTGQSGPQPDRISDVAARHESHRRESQRTLSQPVPLVPAVEPRSASDRRLFEEDPLDKLLPKDISPSAQDDDDEVDDSEEFLSPDYAREDLIDVPLSIAERKRQLAAQSAVSAQAATDEQWHYDESAVAAAAVDSATVEVNSSAPEMTEQPAATLQEEPATPPAAPRNDDNLKPNTDSTRPYPSFSGSPPPKRRQV